MAWELDVCGDEAVDITPTECDDCGKLLQELEELADVVDQIETILTTKQDKLTVGQNIQISDQNVISATDTTYSAGTNVQIDGNNAISATDTTYAAGTGITITGSNNAINAERHSGNTYTKQEVNELIGDLEHVRMEEVSSLPSSGETNIIYLVPKTGGNGHSMYIWDASSNQWVPIGEDTVDLSNYSLKSQTITNITRSGTTFTATRADGTTFTFTQQDNNTTYAASSPITLSNTTFGHANSGVTAGSYGPSANVNGTNGATINVPQITVNATGHVTGVTNRVYTSVNSTYGAATTSAAGLMSAADKAKVDRIGTTYSKCADVSVANGAEVAGPSVTLPAGTYVISAYAEFHSGSLNTGQRRARLRYGSTLKPVGQTCWGADVNELCTFGYVEYLAAQTTVTLMLWQNSGQSLNNTSCLQCVRVN